MPLSANHTDGVSAATAATVDQYHDLLTGVMTDQPVAIANDVTFRSLAVTGLAGATQPTRFVGATIYGPPTTGTFAVGDQVVSMSGTQFICTVSGWPGTWVSTSAGFDVKD